jgi:integrase
MVRSRGNGEGSIYQRSDGKWCAAVTLDTGKRKVLYGKTRQEVAKKLNQALQVREQGLPVLFERQTVANFLKHWLEECVKPSVRQRTYASYAQLVRLHIAPGLGKHQLSRLALQDLRGLLNQRAAGGLSPRTVQYLRAIVHRALSQALKDDLVHRNVAALVDSPRVEKTEVEPFTVEESSALLKSIAGHPLEGVLTLALATGLRQGELLGLTWGDLDLDKATVRVRQQLQRIEGKLTLCPLKTDRARRTLALPAFAIDALRRQRVRQLEAQLLAGDRWQDLGLVFSSDVGTPRDASNLVHRYHKLLDAAGLPRKPFHNLRHSCASFLLAQGADLRTIMEKLGHSQISLTADLYAHVALSLKRQAADSLQERFGSTG